MWIINVLLVFGKSVFISGLAYKMEYSLLYVQKLKKIKKKKTDFIGKPMQLVRLFIAFEYPSGNEMEN